MAQWHYADRDRQQHGPVDEAELRRLFRAGDITRDTLIWNPDLPQWQPLGGFANEIGLQETHSPYAPPTAEVLRDDVVVQGGEIVYAGFWKRAAAYFIDSVITGIAGGVLGGLIGGVMGAMLLSGGDMANSGSSLLAIQGVANLIGLILGVAYFAGFHASASMATLGKMAIGIKVVRSNGERISFLRGMGRYFALFVSAITLFIGFFMAGFTERKRALHDMLCDTVVVDKWAYTDRPDLQRRELGTVTVVVLVAAALLTLLMTIGFIALAVMAASGMH
ncbi:RDD family protein [Thermomonas sp.]|uniref:RDD family protein n=1 Tax=Thermomonas sp. TaxID=1971895 RepID=UPI0026149E8C|nr:RDD family protein [Thermomonas sp.]MCO5055479.1 RDD family protein [Thermomonas sp.]